MRKLSIHDETDRRASVHVTGGPCDSYVVVLLKARKGHHRCVQWTAIHNSIRTEILEFDGLLPSTEYEVIAQFFRLGSQVDPENVEIVLPEEKHHVRYSSVRRDFVVFEPRRKLVDVEVRAKERNSRVELLAWRLGRKRKEEDSDPGAECDPEPIAWCRAAHLPGHLGSRREFPLGGLRPLETHVLFARLLAAEEVPDRNPGPESFVETTRFDTREKPDRGLLLIVGHTTTDSTRMWVRGGRTTPCASVSIQVNGGDDVAKKFAKLNARMDYTAVVEFDGRDGLKPDTKYIVHARFARRLDGLEAEEARVLDGAFRTIPGKEEIESFSFLLGSCNLSIVTLNNLLALGVSLIGNVAMRKAFDRSPDAPVSCLKRAIRWIVFKLYKGLYWLSLMLTRAKQPEPRLPSPFERFSLFEHPGSPPSNRFETLFERDCKNLDSSPESGCRNAAPSFMIHAGDQIYYDFPFPNRKPKLGSYRRAYREAWSEDEHQRRFLAQCPQYMILDDHEIVDQFASDHIERGTVADQTPKDRAGDYLIPARRAYQEYVHARQPRRGGGALYYDFEYGDARFFVLDTRTERRVNGSETRMIGNAQMRAFREWLEENRGKLQFVVTSVPFVAQVRPKKLKRSGVQDTPEGKPELEDKWSGAPFRSQRNSILDLVYRLRIPRLVFLTGDMHCSYHATMYLERRNGQDPREGHQSQAGRLTVHELCSSPVYQLQFSAKDRFYETFRGRTEKCDFRSWLRRFDAGSGGIMRVHVHGGDDGKSGLSKIDWRVIRTVTGRVSEDRVEPMDGRIRFRGGVERIRGGRE